MTTVVQVTRRERAAARLRRELDRHAGRKTDPRVEAIADAKVASARLSATTTLTATATVQRNGQTVGTHDESDESAAGITLVGMPPAPESVEKPPLPSMPTPVDDGPRHGKA